MPAALSGEMADTNLWRDPSRSVEASLVPIPQLPSRRSPYCVQHPAGSEREDLHDVHERSMSHMV
jgi:hypothetical protein